VIFNYETDARKKRRQKLADLAAEQRALYEPTIAISISSFSYSFIPYRYTD
jgi:hypothetical protein